MMMDDVIEDALVRGVLRRRIAAWLVDATLIALLVWAGFYTLLMLGFFTLGLTWPMLGVLPVLPVLYTWLFAASTMGATPGMALFGLILARDADLARPSPLAVLIWAVGYYVTIAAGVIWLAVALITTRRRTIHDLVSGLVVVRMKALTELSRNGIMWGRGSTPA